MPPADQEQLRTLIEKFPQSYVDELQDQLSLLCNKLYTQSLILTTLKRLGFTLKRVTREAQEQDDARRAQFRYDTRFITPSQIVFGDESHLNRAQARRKYGWALHGVPCFIKCKGVSGKGEVSSSAAFVSLEGCLYVNAHKDIIDGSLFISDVTEVLQRMNAFPLDMSVLVLDGAATHLRDQILAIIHNTKPGVLLFFLPPYSYDYNPIEPIFGLAKTALRRYNAGPLDIAFENAIMKAATPAVMCSLFRHCGYPVTWEEEQHACR
jgi:hypothetical protein